MGIAGWMKALTGLDLCSLCRWADFLADSSTLQHAASALNEHFMGGLESPDSVLQVSSTAERYSCPVSSTK